MYSSAICISHEGQGPPSIGRSTPPRVPCASPMCRLWIEEERRPWSGNARLVAAVSCSWRSVDTAHAVRVAAAAVAGHSTERHGVRSRHGWDAAGSVYVVAGPGRACPRALRRPATSIPAGGRPMIRRTRHDHDR
jgi:hypothetical protein